MPRYASVVGLLVGSLLVLASTARAQAGDAEQSPLAAGVRSLSFELSGSGDGSFGHWRMRSERMNLGWEIGVGASRSWGSHQSDTGTDSNQSATGAFVTIGPRFRRYIETDQRVVPFVQTGISVGYSFGRSATGQAGSGSQADSGHGGLLLGSLGVGAEWFPTSRVSVSGLTGLNTDVRYSTRSGSGFSSSAWGLGARTFTSGLSFRIYLMPGSTFR